MRWQSHWAGPARGIEHRSLDKGFYCFWGVIWRSRMARNGMWNMISSPATPTVCLEQKSENFNVATWHYQCRHHLKIIAFEIIYNLVYYLQINLHFQLNNHSIRPPIAASRKYKCEYENNLVWYFRSYNHLFWNVFHEVPIQTSTVFYLTNLELIFNWAFCNETQKQCYYHYYQQWMGKTSVQNDIGFVIHIWYFLPIRKLTLAMFKWCVV